MLYERFEVGQLWIDLAEVRAFVGGELGPMRTRVEGREFLLDEGEDLLDLGPLTLPGEVDGEGVLLVGHAEPEVVGGDDAQLGGEQVRGDVVFERLHGADGLVGVGAGNEVFGLQLFAAGGGKVHAEVGQALVPGTGDVHLRSAVDGVERGDGMEIFGGELAVVEEGGRVEFFAGLDETLKPELGGTAMLPVGEDADAVAGGEDVVEVVFELGEGKVGVDGLRDLEGGFDVEGDVGHDAEQAEVDDSSIELVTVLGAREGLEGAVGVYELDGGDGGREIFVVDTGAVGSGSDGSRDGDVGQRGEVVQGEALGVDHWGHITVADAGSDGDGFCSFIELDVLEVGERDLGVGAVGEAVEGVAGAEGADAGVVFDDLLELGDGGGLEEIVGVVGQVS